MDEDCLAQFAIFEGIAETKIPFPTKAGIYLFLDRRGTYLFKNIGELEENARYYSGPSEITKLYFEIIKSVRGNIKKIIAKLSILEPILMNLAERKAAQKEKESSSCSEVSDFTYFLMTKYLKDEFKDICSDFGDERVRRNLLTDLIFDSGSSSASLVKANNEIAQNQQLIQKEVYGLSQSLDITEQNVRITSENIHLLNQK